MVYYLNVNQILKQMIHNINNINDNNNFRSIGVNNNALKAIIIHLIILIYQNI